MMKRMMGVALVAGALAGCSDAKTAIRALEGAGYTEVETTGWSFFGCGENDTFKTSFKAKGPTGKPVAGVVCSGWLKGATIRTD